MTETERLKNLLASNPEFAKIWENQIKEEEKVEDKKAKEWSEVGTAIRNAYSAKDLNVFDPEVAKVHPTAILTAHFLNTFYSGPMTNFSDEELIKLYDEITYFNVTVPIGYEEILEFRDAKFLMVNLQDDKGLYTKIFPYPFVFAASL